MSNGKGEGGGERLAPTEDETRIAPVVHAYGEIDAPASTRTQIILLLHRW